MKTSVFLLAENKWTGHSANLVNDNAKVQLILCFAEKFILTDAKMFSSIKEQYPAADILMCSTAGEIYQNSVQEKSLVLAALQFENSKIYTSSVNINDFANSYDAAVNLADKLPKEDLSYIMIFSDGRLVNGSELVKGLNAVAGKNVMVTGGLAGDDINFQSTLVGLNEQPVEGKIVAIGLYGKNITVSHGSKGGWDIFGLEKEITRSTGNVLHEMDNRNALDLYKKYLGPEVKNLPGSALLFPLSIIIPGTTEPVVRTILSIDDEEKTMTFAGDIPTGAKVRFMKANFDKLIEAATTAAEQTLCNQERKPDFALLISCIGRKIILGQRTVEEAEAVNEVYQNKTMMAGFYSYGEISPADNRHECQLHNQTITITSFYEHA